MPEIGPSTPRGKALYQGFLQLADQAADYFRPWTYEVPLAIRRETDDALRRVQQLYLKCIRHFVAQYDRYRDLMPVSDTVADILQLCRRRPYRPGTYRTDFVVDRDNQIKLIETTCRYALNGYFTSGFTDRLADRFLQAHPSIRKVDDYTPFYDRMMEYFGPFDHVCYLKGSDQRNDTKYIVPLLEAAGFPVHMIPAEEVPGKVHRFEGAAVIGELSHEEVCRLPRETIVAMVDAGILNDLRTAFLLHDKRFFALLCHDAFLRAALSAGEIDFLRPYLIPTFTRRMAPEVWAQARAAKDRWIIKPYNKGKSIDVFAGCLTPAAEWDALFASGRADAMVLQEFIPQRRFRGTIAGKAHQDYVVGTLLFFEEEYFGLGICRASSYPITNKVDDRKVAPLVTEETSYFEPDNVL